MNDDLLAQFLATEQGGEGGAAITGGEGGATGGEGGAAGGAAGGSGEGGGEGGGAATGGKTEQLLAQVIAQNKELKDKIQTFAEREIPSRAGTEPFLPAAQPGADQLAQVKEALNRKFMTDPGGAMLDMLGMMQQISAKQTESMQLPLAQAQSQMLLEGFLASKKSEPYFDKVSGEFNAIIDRAITQRGVNLGKLSAQQLKDGLEDAWEQAVGRAALKGGASRSQPPPYSTGQGGGAGNFVMHRGGAIDALEARDAVEQEIINTMRGVDGIDDNDIKATLKAYREENGG